MAGRRELGYARRAIAGPPLTADWPVRRLLAGALCASALAAVPSADAATYTAGCSGGTGSVSGLVTAIELANLGAGADTVALGAGCTYSIGAPNNHWYGPNGLPPIASDVTLQGNGATIARAPAAPPFRFFFVGAGATNPTYLSPGPGKLTLREVTLRGGFARGGGSDGGGGGAGLGGAIFSQGTVVVERSTLTGNTAQGGSALLTGAGPGGGGIGTDAGTVTAGGFGPGTFPAVQGGTGGSGTPNSGGAGGNGGAGGGGAGFRAGGTGTPGSGTTPGDGGGEQTGLGGFGDSAVFGGDGSGGGGDASTGGAGGSPAVGGGGGNGGDGGDFGAGGEAGGAGSSASTGPIGGGGAGGGGGGGGVGGGGGAGGRGGPELGAGFDGPPGRGGGGGFGGGGGLGGASCSSGSCSGTSHATGGTGGFGGGGGRHADAGFGGGEGTNEAGGGGAGMGGAIFSMQGAVTISASTLAGNTAGGGTGGEAGQGLGGAVLNLSGSLQVVGSTFAQNNATGDGSSLLSLVLDAREARTAGTRLRDTIVFDGSARPELVASKPATAPDGQANLGTSTATAGEVNLVRTGAARGAATLTPAPLTANPLLGALTDNGGPTPTMAPGAGSPAVDAGASFGLTRDQRGLPRPSDFPGIGNALDGSDLGAVELQVPGPAQFGEKTLVTLKLAARRIRARGPIRVRVRNANVFAVPGRLGGQTVKRLATSAQRRRVRVRAKAFQVSAGGRRVVRLKVSRPMRRALRRNRKLALRLAATVRDPAGNRRVVRKRVLVRLKKG